MRNHFIVVTLLELKKGQPRSTIVDPVPLMSNEFVDTRNAFLEKCQMYHWQFDELRNAQHSTLMLLYYLHGMHKAAKQKLADRKPSEVASTSAPAPAPAAAAPAAAAPSAAPAPADTRSRTTKLEMAMDDWSQLLAHANQAALAPEGAQPTWELPPEDLFQRILTQINRSKRDFLQNKYTACCDPATSAQSRSAFIIVLKRIAEDILKRMSCLLEMQHAGRDRADGTSLPAPSSSAAAPSAAATPSAAPAASLADTSPTAASTAATDVAAADATATLSAAADVSSIAVSDLDSESKSSANARASAPGEPAAADTTPPAEAPQGAPVAADAPAPEPALPSEKEPASETAPAAAPEAASEAVSTEAIAAA